MDSTGSGINAISRHGYLKTAAAGAVAMIVPELATRPCLQCDPWGLAFRLGQLVVAGSLAGLLVALALPIVTRLGRPGQYSLGILSAWVVAAVLQHTAPFVRGSFFVGGPGPLDIAIVSVILGSFGTFELRRRYRRLRERAADESEPGDAGPPWLGSLSFTRQATFASVAVLLAASASTAWNRYLAPGWDVEQFNVEMRAAVAANPNDAASHYYLARGLMESRLWEEALPVAQRALELDASVPAHHEAVGWALIGALQESAALDHFRHAAELAPRDSRLWRDYARAAHMLGERADALAAYRHLDDLTISRVLWPYEDRNAWEELHRESR